MNVFDGKKVHMVGIKGVGMTALAEILLDSGAVVTGSDTREEFHTDQVLKRLCIKPLDFSASNITSGLDLVIYSSAYDDDNIEIKKARKIGIKQINYADALSSIFNQKKGVLIVGSHGKTTTTALLSHIMISAGLDPTVVVGGTVIGWNSNVRIGKSEWMVAEGDEYQEKFLKFRPHYLLITNVDYDHPDTFPNRNSYKEVFEKLKNQTSKKVLYPTPDLPAEFRNLESDYLIGEHNKKNLGLVLASAREFGISDEDIKNGFYEFRGVRRRMEIYSQKDGLIIMDDYAHHPVEISSTLSAVKRKWPDHKITVIFQPHTFSRTKTFLNEFAKAFKHADAVYLVPTYSSARESIQSAEKVDEMLFESVTRNHTSCFKGVPSEKKVLGEKRPRVIITMGAGDIWQFARKLYGEI